MSIRRRRLLSLGLMLFAHLVPLVTLLPVGFVVFSHLADWATTAVIVTALFITLVLQASALYSAAEAAVLGELPGGPWTLLGIWWLMGMLVALTNWSYRLADALVKAATLGVVEPAANAMNTTPAALAGLGVSSTWSLGLPLAALWLMGCYVVVRRQRRGVQGTDAQPPALGDWDGSAESLPVSDAGVSHRTSVSSRRAHPQRDVLG